MKKLFLLVVSAFIISTTSWAWELVPLSVHISDDDKPVGHGHNKPSIEIPKVYIEDYTLSFETNHPDYVLTIKDENGDVVYSTTVFSAQTQVVLPSTLSGDYEIQLVMGNCLFTGWINF